jgi:hypothetical protein
MLSGASRQQELKSSRDIVVFLGFVRIVRGISFDIDLSFQEPGADEESSVWTCLGGRQRMDRVEEKFDGSNGPHAGFCTSSRIR